MQRAASHRLRRASIAALAVAALLAVTACGDDDAGSSGTTAAKTTEATGAGTTSAPLAEMSTADKEAVDAAIQAGRDRLGAAGLILAPPALYVGVWDPAKGAYLTVQGDAAEGRPATVEDHFRIGSVTKTFTASVILQLVDEGKLSLDDTVDELLPDLAAEHPELEGITVESLLNMTSRIEDYMNVKGGVAADIVADPQRVWTPEELIAEGLKPGLLPEGTARYSTTNLIILQLIAESIDGKPLADSIAARLTEPLGMTQTSLPIEETALPEPYAAGHLNDLCVQELTEDGATGVDTSVDPTAWSMSSTQGGGGMTSTLADLGRWADSNSGNQLLSDDLQAARMDTTSVLGEEPFTYGLGMFQLGDGWFGHSGEAIGWQTLVVHNPDTGVSVAFAANACAGEDFVFWSVLNELYPNAPLDTFLTSQLGG